MFDPGYEIQKAEVVKTSIGSKKTSHSFLELSKFKFYLLLHGIFLGPIFLYQSIWLFSNTTTAYCYAYNADNLTRRNIDPGTLVYHYLVEGKQYMETTTRNGIPLNQHHISIKYLPFAPSWSRPDTFEANWVGFMIAWGLFFVITSMIFFIPNETMPRNSYFYFTKRKPWVNMIVK